MTVRAMGELDVASASDLEEELRRAFATDASAIVVDLAEVSFMDSSGLRALLIATSPSNINGRRFGVRRELTAAVQRTLEITGTAEKLPFVD
jgi:anti-anti-sigma factor